jgi:azurin
MRFRILSSLLFLAFFVSGCGQKESSPGGAGASGGAAGTQSGPRTVEITAGDNMKFSLSRIEAKPGEELTVVLTNIGSQPKEVMGHNWVLLKAGTNETAFNQAAVAAKDAEYIPASLSDQVIAHTKLLGPRKSDEVTFTVPETPGEYPFICTFPGHFAIGMKGVLVVR